VKQWHPLSVTESTTRNWNSPSLSSGQL